jgi:hypothetical protein
MGAVIIEHDTVEELDLFPSCGKVWGVTELCSLGRPNVDCCRKLSRWLFFLSTCGWKPGIIPGR